MLNDLSMIINHAQLNNGLVMLNDGSLMVYYDSILRVPSSQLFTKINNDVTSRIGGDS